MEAAQFPKILVITEEPLRANSLGFGRTLTNILQHFPRESLFFYVPEHDFSHPDYKTYDFPFITFGFKALFCAHKRRYAAWINRILDWLNCSFQFIRRPHKIDQQLRAFDPDVLLLVPMQYSTLLEGYCLQRRLKKNLFIYLMDDTFHDKGWHWGGRKQVIIKKTLQQAAGWIMISKYLAETLEMRFAIKAAKMMVLHNPIKLDHAITEFIPLNREHFIIAYAGSVHAFHADALLNVARAVCELRKEGVSIELKVYTRDDFWQHYQIAFEQWQVTKGGFIKYEDLFTTLNHADLLLCTTSFEREYYALVASSVFTKLTDYMASGRPVWCYGPSYAANNRFLQDNEIGMTYSEKNVADLITFLKRQLNAKASFNLIVQKQTGLLENSFNETFVRNGLISFCTDQD